MSTRKFLYQLSTLTVLIGMAFNLIGCMGVLPRTTDQQADEPVEQYGNGYRYEKKRLDIPTHPGRALRPGVSTRVPGCLRASRNPSKP